MCDLIYLQVLPPGAKYYKNDSNYKLQIAQKEKKRTKHSERESERESGFFIRGMKCYPEIMSRRVRCKQSGMERMEIPQAPIPPALEFPRLQRRCADRDDGWMDGYMDE